MARWIDTYTNRGEKLCPKGDLKWGQKQSESHRLSTNPEETVELNYREELTQDTAANTIVHVYITSRRFRLLQCPILRSPEVFD